jgi:cytochrome c peroxidase
MSSLASAGDYDARVELGRRLFMDPTVSRGGRFSCAACHDPERGFSDAREFSLDETGNTRRHSQPLLDLAPERPLHWDGEFGSIRELLTARLAPRAEALETARQIRTRHFEEAASAGRKPDEGEFRKTIASLVPPYYGPEPTVGGAVPVPILVRLAEDDRYSAAFIAAYGTSSITTEKLIDAMHAYVLTLRSGRNDFDRYHAGDPGALTPQERRGLDLFTGKADCAACHTIDARSARPLFSDGAFHNTGVTFRSAAIEFGGGLAIDGGAGEMSFVALELGRFKTPSLRDVARRAPYMHDGSLSTLEEVVRYYDHGGTPNRLLDRRVRPLHLTEEEVKDLVAFLESLTGAERAGIGPALEGSRLTRIRVLDLQGRPFKGLAVEIRPAGDRLEGGRAGEMPQLLATDADGYLAFDFPSWTHVRLVSPTHEIHYDWLIPDCIPRMTVMAAPRDKVALKLRVAKGGGELPMKLVAVKPGTGDLVANLRRVRRVGSDAAIYVAERRVVPGPFVASIDGVGGPFEIDLSGGWAEPLDLRQG